MIKVNMIEAFLSILAAVFAAVSLAGCQEASDTKQAELTSSQVQQTTSAAEQVTSIAETETEIGVDTAVSPETGSENEDTSIETGSEETSSYVLDPEITFTLDIYSGGYTNQPLFIGSPEGSGANVYVMTGDESKKWTYHSTLFSDVVDISEYVIIEHDGIIDEIPCNWGQRFGGPFSIYSGDYDGDGEFEIAALRYATGGTFLCVYELTIFKMIDGHYQQFLLDNIDMLKKYTSYEIDTENNTVKFMVNEYDTSITVDIDEPEYFNGVRYGNDLRFSIDGDKITVNIDMFLVMREIMLDDIAELTMTVNFADGEFICTDPVFELLEE